MHIVNTVSPFLPGVLDQKFTLLFHGLWILCWWFGFGTFQMSLWTLHCATCLDKRFVGHIIFLKALPARSATPSLRLLWCAVTRPPFFQSRAYKLKSWHCILHTIWLGLGALSNITGRGNPAIPEHPVLCYLLWMAAPSTMPLYSWPAASGVQLGRVQPLGSLTLLSLPTKHSSFTPLALLWGLLNSLPSVTPTIPWILQPGVLWWHRTSLSSQCPSLWGLIGPPDLISGSWPLSPGFLPLRPGRGPAGNILGVHRPLVWRCPWFWG